MFELNVAIIVEAEREIASNFVRIRLILGANAFMEVEMEYLFRNLLSHFKA
jgi:hypothetical protein